MTAGRDAEINDIAWQGALRVPRVPSLTPPPMGVLACLPETVRLEPKQTSFPASPFTPGTFFVWFPWKALFTVGSHFRLLPIIGNPGAFHAALW